MSLLVRITDFQPGTIIQSAQVDSEFNQLVDLLSGISTLKEAFIKNNDVGTVPALKLQNVGGGHTLQCIDSGGTIVFRVDGNGNTQIGKLGSAAGVNVSIFGTNPSITLLNTDFEDFTISNDNDQVDFDLNNYLPIRIRGAANDDIAVRNGPGTELMMLGGTFNQNITTVGNILTGVDDLHSYSLPANTFAKDGDSLQVVAGGRFANNTNSKQIINSIGGTTFFDSTAIAFQNGGWTLRMDIIRIDSDSVRIAFEFSVNAGSGNLSYGNTVQVDGLTFTSAIILKWTGTATATDDITQTMSILRKFPKI